MIHFHTLTVAKVQKETEDSVSITFAVPDALKEVFQFKQGQYLTVRTVINGEELRRNYSICSSPLDGVLRMAVKKVEGGVFSTYANAVLKKGDTLDVMPPLGKFGTHIEPGHQKNYVAFAAGSGITPLLSIIKTALLTQPHSTFTLVYGNRSKSTILFKEELEALKDKHLQRFRLIHVLSRERSDAPLNYGRIDAPKCDQLFEKLISLQNVDEFFVCGPEEMIFCVRDYLISNGVANEAIHFELFTIPGQKKSVVDTALNAPADSGPKAAVTVKLDGIMFDFPLGYNGKSILDAALGQGADLPYACKGGVCCTCKAKLLQGTVAMDVNWGLEPDEVAQGFILTCQSHPTSSKVVVDFDVK